MAPRRLTRRQTLLGGGALAVTLGSASFRSVARAAMMAPAGSDIGAIEHVVFLMQENRSFDHYFGSYRGVRGFDDHRAGSFGNFAQPYPANTNDPPVGFVLPYHLDTATSESACTEDLTHAWGPQHACWNAGAMDSFVKVHASPAQEGPVAGLHTMGYYTRADLPYYYALADAFTICDGYHCSVLGPTHPNRLMSLSATIDPAGLHGGPVLITNGDPDALWSVDWPTMPEMLEDAGISWKVYSPPAASPLYELDYNMGAGDAILPYFKAYKSPLSVLYQKSFLPIYPVDFALDVLTNRLPAVSWIVAETGFDEHPPAPAALGEWFTSTALDALTANPEVWAKTVLFVMYDENDGWFDHVAPPTPPPGTPGEYVTVNPLPATAAGIAGPVGLGFRVPMLVISPFSRGGHVDHGTYDHTSQLRFLETRFGVEVPNLSAWRRSVTGDLTSTVGVNPPDSSRPRLPVPSALPKVALTECSVGEDIELGGGTNPRPASPQVLPTQERS